MHVTEMTHTALQETKTALATAKNGSTWRAVSTALNVPHATLFALATDDLAHVSHVSFNRIRHALGLPPVPAPLEVPPCPDCGAVHTGRCHGKTVIQVVTLAPGERVTRKSTRIIRRWADLPRAELARAITERVPFEFVILE